MTSLEQRFTLRGFSGAKETLRTLRLVRPDGLEVHLDKVARSDRFAPLLLWLNKVRLNGTPEEVIASVAKVRGIQIAVNYAEKSGMKHDLERITESIGVSAKWFLAKPRGGQ